MPPEELNKKLIDEQLKANSEALKGATMGDLINKSSGVYKAPKVPKEATPIPEKPKFDAEGFPVIENVRTYQGDIKNAVERENVSMSKIMMAEGVKRNKAGELIAPSLPKKTFGLRVLLVILVGFLFFGGISAVMFSYIRKNKIEAPVPVTETKNEIIAIEEKTNISLDDKTVSQVISATAEEMKKLPKDPAIRKINFTKKTDGVEKNLTLSEFLGVLDMRTPETLVRNLYDEYFFGIDFVGTGRPFLIMFTSSYDIAYAGLLEWEQTLVDDFKTVSQNIYKPEQTYSFKDRIILNKDIRALQDNTGNIVFFYSIIDQNTIIFATNSETFKEILERLRIAKLKN